MDRHTKHQFRGLGTRLARLHHAEQADRVQYVPRIFPMLLLVLGVLSSNESLSQRIEGFAGASAR